eukprot:761243-Hanusia_phi.AAC.5
MSDEGARQRLRRTSDTASCPAVVFRDYKEDSPPSVYSVSSREEASHPAHMQRSQQIWVPESLEVIVRLGGNRLDVISSVEHAL